MLRTLLIVSAVGFLSALVTGMRPARADELDDFVRAEMHRRHVPGLSVAVVKDGRVVREGGYGFANLEWHIPASPDTLYTLHSVSKMFTAAGILLLSERGKVGLDDPVSRYFPDAPESWRGITIRHLLTHTSGIPDYLNEPAPGLPDGASDEETVRAVMKRPVKFAPGARWSYCNTGYLMLGLVIRKASGVSATEFLRREIFAPVGMAASRAISRTEVIPHRASKYNWVDGRWQNAEFPFDTEQISDSGMLSTVRDMARWDEALTDGRVLSPASRRAMWTAYTLTDGSSSGYGFGWFVGDLRGHRRLSHEGASFNGQRTIIARFPDDGLSVIVLTNGGTPDLNLLASGVASHFVPSLTPPQRLPAAKDPDPARTAALRAFLTEAATGGDPRLATDGLRRSTTDEDRKRAETRFRNPRDFTYLACDDVRGKGIVRHGSTVARECHYRIGAAEGTRTVTFYLTASGEVADWTGGAED